MEGELSMEDSDEESSTSSTRRRVLKASAALSATGVVSASGFVGSAAGTNTSCSISTQCDASITFNDQVVGDGTCPAGTTPDSATVEQVVFTCDDGGWIDLHDGAVRTGPSGTYKAGYPVGMSTIFQDPGTYTNVEICLFQNCVDIPNRTECTLEWNRTEWVNDQKEAGSRSMIAMCHLDGTSPGEITHYCTHKGPEKPEDHAYLCDQDNDGDLEPITDAALITGDGDG